MKWCSVLMIKTVQHKVQCKFDDSEQCSTIICLRFAHTNKHIHIHIHIDIHKHVDNASNIGSRVSAEKNCPHIHRCVPHSTTYFYSLLSITVWGLSTAHRIQFRCSAHLNDYCNQNKNVLIFIGAIECDIPAD